MPHLATLIQPRGPLLQVIIATTEARRTALAAGNLPTPMPVIASLLIDTGASHSCICTSVISKLGLQPTGTTGMNTPSTGASPVQCSTYDVDLMIPHGTAGQMKHIKATPVIEADFSLQGHQGLIGRDLLGDFRMIYSGPDNFLMLSY